MEHVCNKLMAIGVTLSPRSKSAILGRKFKCFTVVKAKINITEHCNTMLNIVIVIELELRTQVELKYLALFSQLEVLVALEFSKICP